MDKYVVLEQLGNGTYGIVYKAVNTNNNELVAIKKMKKKYINWEECLNLQEIKALIGLKHPNIVVLRELILNNDELDLIFYYDGINLYDHMMSNNTKGLSELEIRNIIYQVLQGLSYMHKNSFIHRDIKPENILMRNDCIKIADFGLAKETKQRPPYTDYVATRWYRAPEVILKSKIYGSAIDIFAIGAIMAELYNSKPLFPGKSEHEQMNKICEVLGTPGQIEWQEGYSLASRMNYKFPNYKGHKLRNLIPRANEKAINLIESMLNFNPLRRPSASQCLQHPFFQCYDSLSIYTLKSNNSFQFIQQINNGSITSQNQSPEKNNNVSDLTKRKISSNSNLANFINVKKNSLPKLQLLNRVTNLTNININNNQVKYNHNNNQGNINNEKSASMFTSNIHSLKNKSQKAKIEDFMMNFFKN